MLQLSVCRRRFEIAVGVEETLHDPGPPHAGGCFEVQRRAVLGEELGGIRLTVSETRKHEGMTIPREPPPVHAGAVGEQKLHKRVLYAGLLRMNAGGNEAK